MNIAVIQPQGHGSGTTTVAALIASELASRNKQVCLTNTKPVSEALYPYYNIDTAQEKHNASLELINLIKFGGIKKEKVGNYCRNIFENLDLFVINAPFKKGELSEDDLTSTVKFFGTSSPYDYVVYDVDEKQLQKPAVRTLLSIADICVVVLTQDSREAARFMEQKEEFTKAVRKLPVIVVVNKYSSVLGSVKELAAAVGMKNTKNWCAVHLNQYIPYCENRGQLCYLAKQLHSNAPEVVELNRDIWHIVQKILDIRKIHRNQRIEMQRAHCSTFGGGITDLRADA